ncbi:MAG: twin transmembrane helix small protein [Gammaproteobacteria bacterium]|nr:twin transmembrane helix small protein [Gammaproteobacteria bacterium]NNM20012.1 twin transmembrane helix small protein [Gammaproteobacteria bacterium]
MTILNLIVILALLSTIGALVFGVVSMARGGQHDAGQGEKFMWERVGFQTVAVVLIFAALFLINT